MAMKASCVNVLNKTVSTVCKLENQILSNTDNISFLNKYLNFNKNLLLSIMGNNIEMNVDMVHYSLDPSFIKNKQLKLFILGILKYLFFILYEKRLANLNPSFLAISIIMSLVGISTPLI